MASIDSPGNWRRYAPRARDSTSPVDARPIVDTPVPFEDARELIVGRRASDVLAVHLDTVKVGEAQARSRGLEVGPPEGIGGLPTKLEAYA